ncbi:MAG: glycoside hydrolase family 3 protein, partial [Ruthenibacterium sp.]
MVEIRKKPFYLTEEKCEWVRKTLESMTLEEKIGQLFCCVSLGESKADLLEKYNKIHFGGIMFRADKAKNIKEQTDFIQSKAKIPMLISANLENGGTGIATDGTEFASQLEVAATGNPEYAYLLGDICGSEGASVGINYAFAPVVDVHRNWRNPIIVTRTYGSDPEKVLAFSTEYMKGITKHNVAVCIKHFPGDGIDERDQHLVSSVNTLICDEWDESFGKIYGDLIKQGAQTVMAGHILLPEYSKRLCPGIEDKDILPASLSKEILTGLLREKLGFNGMIITDSAIMTGMSSAMQRRDIPAAAINAGCDMFLFGRNLYEDYANMLADAASGVISADRIQDALTRVLALKASIGLDTAKKFTDENYKEKIACPRHKQLAKECADKAITLVKDTQKLLPVSPQTHRRVWLYILGDNPAFRGGALCKDSVMKALKVKGFDVTCFDTSNPEEGLLSEPVSVLKERFDLIIYIGNIVSGGNDTVNRIKWAPFACGESPQYVKDIPTMFISLGDPYHF